MAKLRTKKKRRIISFLILPDDYSEPKSFKLCVRSLKVLIVIAGILVCHMIIGGICYYKYFYLHEEAVELRARKIELEAENSRIYNLAARSQELEKILQKLKISLGIEPGSAADRVLASEIPESSERDSQFQTDNELIPNFDNFSSFNPDAIKSVSNKKSTFHAFFENYPTFLPVAGIISREFDKSEFHEPLSGYQHFGIDIAARKGSIVKAAGSGVIVFAGWTTDLGNLMIIYHGDGIFTYYAHNLRLLRQGGKVKKGGAIALLGSSGRTSTAPHLHFEIWRDGEPVDPKEFLFSLQNPILAEKEL